MQMFQTLHLNQKAAYPLGRNFIANTRGSTQPTSSPTSLSPWSGESDWLAGGEGRILGFRNTLRWSKCLEAILYSIAALL